MNGLVGVTFVGLSALIICCSETLVDFEAAFNDQDGMKSDLFLKLGYCWELETLDVSGCSNLDDMAV